MSEAQSGSRENPIYMHGDYYTILRELMGRGKNVYFIFNEMVLFLNDADKRLRLVEVRSEDRTVILSAIAQTMALAQEFHLWPESEDKILGHRFGDVQLKF